MIVLDAGATYELLAFRGHGGPVAAALRSARDEAFAPELLDVEVLSAFRRTARSGGLAVDVSREIVDGLRRLPVTRVRHEPLVPRVWELRDRVSAYDATYIALAELLGAETTLVTTDGRLVRAAEALGTVATLLVPVP